MTKQTYQCGSCEKTFNKLKDNSCPYCASGNWVHGCIDDLMPKSCTCEYYGVNKPHEYTCALNINQVSKPTKQRLTAPLSGTWGSKPSFTPAPWSIWNDNHAYVLSGKITICEVYNRNDYAPRNENERIASPEQARANARLIRKAPEMYEALKEALAMLKIYYKPNSDCSTPTIAKIESILKEIEQ